MKLDKISIIGIALAGLLIILNFQFGTKNQKDLAQREAESPSAVSEITQQEQKASSLATASLPDDFQDEKITLKNEETEFEFSTATGGLYRTTIIDQHEYKQPDIPVQLNRFAKKSIGGLETRDGRVLDAGYKYEVTENSVTFLGKLSNGVIAKKEWTLTSPEEEGGNFRLDYKLTLENPTDQVAQASEMNVFVGSATPLHNKELPDQSGYFYLADNKYKKHKSNSGKFLFFGSEFTKNSKQLNNLTYLGVGNQFFVNILTPKDKYNAEFTAIPRTVTLPDTVGGGEKKEASLAVSLPDQLINNNGGIEQFHFDVYSGPKKYQSLKKLEPYAGSAMNYGIFHWISRPLNNCLHFFHNKIFSNFAGPVAWGLSIILLTLFLRTLMWPLTWVSIKSSKRMGKLQPMIKELKEKYPDDPQKVQQEQMKLFSEYGINPVAGCLPILLQIPIFFGLFTMLKSAVEFRHEKFLWIKDLTEPDTLFTIPIFGFELPINILPILMFITMAIQMSMNPTPTDPMQKMIMRFMPIMMVIFCYGFASALALYWTTSNIFTIFQTWIMKIIPSPELKKRKAPKKGGFMEKLQKQAEELQRMKEQQSKGGSSYSQTKAGMRDAKPKKPRGPKTGG